MTQGEIVEYHPTIRELPVSERPRERLEHYGDGAFSTSDALLDQRLGYWTAIAAV